jgi:hypothetical protein
MRTVAELIVGHDLLYHPITFDPQFAGPPCIHTTQALTLNITPRLSFTKIYFT